MDTKIDEVLLEKQALQKELRELEEQSLKKSLNLKQIEKMIKEAQEAQKMMGLDRSQESPKRKSNEVAIMSSPPQIQEKPAGKQEDQISPFQNEQEIEMLLR